MGVQSCGPDYRDFVGLVTTGQFQGLQCDMLKSISRLSEKVRETQKGLQGTEDKSLDEEKRKQKEPTGQDNGDRFLDSVGHAVGRDPLMRQKELEGTADRELLNKKRVEKLEKEELKDCHMLANNSLPQTEPVEPIDGVILSDADECLESTATIEDLWIHAVRLVVFIGSFCGILFENLFRYLPLGDTSQNEKREDQNHPPLKVPKLGKQRYILKNGLGLCVLIAVLSSQLPGTMAASVTVSPLTTEPAMKADLPYACTDVGSQANDTWLDREEVKAMKRGSVFDGSDKGYTDICPNAFHGLCLREINLSKNLLAELPDHLFESVQELHRLLLDHNLFTTVPAALNEYPGIEFIGISYNDMKEIPRGALSNVTSLHGLDVSGNKNLGQYPSDIFLFQNFRLLNVSNTAISSPPHPPCLSQERIYNYSLKCSEDHMELWNGSSKLTFYFQNLSAFYRNWNIENCSNPEGMQFHSDCKTSTSEPVDNESSTDSVVSVTQSSLHPGVSDGPSFVKNDKAKGGPILFIFIFEVIFCGVSVFLKVVERRSVHIRSYVMVGLWVILIALPVGTFVVTVVCFGFCAALAVSLVEYTVIAILACDFCSSCSLNERSNQNESEKLEVNSFDGNTVFQNATDTSIKIPEENPETETHS